MHSPLFYTHLPACLETLESVVENLNTFLSRFYVYFDFFKNTYSLSIYFYNIDEM